MAVITVSRLPGSLGDEMGQQLAQRLGYRFIGRAELLRLASELGPVDSLDRSPELVERSPSFWERLNEERRRYSGVLRSVVVRLAEEDDAVIMGLGAGQFLKGLHQVLRLQVIAPLEQRVERVMAVGLEQRPGPLTREQARDLVRQRDREGIGYMRYLFNIDLLDPQNWDVVLNTGRFDVSQCVEFVAAMVQSGALAPRPEDTQRLANLALSSRVESALLTQGSVWVNGLRVVAEEGRVRLEGEVIGEEDRDFAEAVARSVPGVRVVDNDLRIQPPPLTGM